MRFSMLEHKSRCILWNEVNDGDTASSQNPALGRGRENRWQKPSHTIVKCNVNGSRRNPTLLCGGSWVARDYTGSVLYHSRKAFTSSRNRITAEFRCLIWAMKSLQDMHFRDVVVASDCKATYEAIPKPLE